MHIPKKFKQENMEYLVELMQQYSFATVITQSESGIEATHLPVVVVKNIDKFYLKAHIAKANPLWESVTNDSDVLVTFNGPSCYISPNNYPTKKETGKAVPTWNYVVVHVKGKISFIHDSEWIFNAVDTLTTIHESEQPEPWSISDAPDDYIQKMLSAIVGIEVEVTSITGQWKLSQNQPEANQRGVAETLVKSADSNTRKIASMMNVNF